MSPFVIPAFWQYACAKEALSCPRKAGAQVDLAPCKHAQCHVPPCVSMLALAPRIRPFIHTGRKRVALSPAATKVLRVLRAQHA